MSVYPGGQDDLPTTKTDFTGDPASAPTSAVLTAAEVNLIGSAIEAIEGELGLNPSGTSATVAARLDAVDAALGGKLATGGTAANTAAVGGITVTGTPTTGQVLKATSSSAATWQTDATGGGGGSVTIDADGTISDGTTTIEVALDADVTALAATVAGKANTTHVHSAADVTSGTLPLARGGTGGTDAATARTSLGLGTAATQAATAFAPVASVTTTLGAVSTATTGTLVAGQMAQVDATAAAAARTLPAANSVSAGTVVGVKKVDGSANAVTVSRAGADTITGTALAQTSRALTLAGESVEFTSDGTAVWVITSTDTPSPALNATFGLRAPDWVTGRAYIVGELVTSGGTLYRCTTAHTSAGAINLGNFSALGGSGGVASVAGLTGVVTAQQLLSNSTIDAALESLVPAGDLGSVAGVPVSPATVPALVHDERWNTTMLANGPGFQTTLTGSATVTTGQTALLRWMVPNCPADFRLRFDWNSTITTGNAVIRGYLSDSAGNKLSTSGSLHWGRNSSSGTVVFDGGHDGANITSFGFVLEIVIGNNTTGGTLSFSNVSFRQVGSIQPVGYFQRQFGVTQFFQWHPDRALGRKRWRAMVHNFQGEGDFTGFYPNSNNSFVDERCNTNSSYFYDPLFRQDAGAQSGQASSIVTSGTSSHQMRTGNSDQIISVKTPGGSFNGYELRGNVHQGEYLRGSQVCRVDNGTGLQVVTAPTEGNGYWARRVQFTVPTEYYRVRGDAGTKFAEADRTVTIFPDGMQRVDRTTTFTSTETIGRWFEWMSTHGAAPDASGYIARVGSGRRVTGESDMRKVIAPTASVSSSTATTGGTLTAGTRRYAVTALTAAGETTGVTTQVTSTGTTSANTVTWTAVSGATGYAIYRQINNTYYWRMAQVGPGATSWVDDGSLSPTPTKMPTRNTAVLFPYMKEDLFQNAIWNQNQNWQAIYDVESETAFGNIIDLESVLARPQVASVVNQTVSGKLYAVLSWASGTPEAPKPSEPSIVIPSGTVWTATHWSYHWVPADKTNWHNEIATLAAAGQTALKALYPNT